MPVEAVWEILSEHLYFLHHVHEFRIHSFVLMSNHFHMIASAPSEQFSKGMQHLLSNSSRKITKAADRVDHTWRAHFFRRPITSPQYYLHAYKYFYRNPVEAGLCKFVEEYPFSTLHGLLGLRHLLIPVIHDDTLFSNVEGTLAWLNRAPKEGYKRALELAMRRQEFKLPVNPKTRRVHPLEEEEY